MEISKKVKNAIIVEYEYHFGFLHLLIRILVFGGYKVDVYCSEKFISYCKKSHNGLNKVNLISKYPPFIGVYKAISASKKANLFIHFSVQAHKLTTFVRLLKPRAKINILYTPRISNWHDQNFHLSLAKKDLINNYFNIFRYFIKKNYKFYIVHSKQTAEYVEFRSNTKVINLPYTIRLTNSVQLKHNSDQTKIKVTILGSIDKERRDYLSVFNLNIFKKFNLSNVIFELAGVSNGSDYASGSNKDDYFNKIRYLSKQISKVTGCEFIFYDSRLDDFTYTKAIINADILLMPINFKNYPLGGWSAGLAESIEYDKRVMLPKKYEVPHEYPKDYFIFENTTDLLRTITNLAKNKSKCVLTKAEKIKRMGEFGLEEVSQRFFETLQTKG